MAVPLKRFYRIKLINSALAAFIAISFLAINVVHAHEETNEKPEFRGIIDKPLTGNATKKTGQLDIENGFERYFFYTLYQIGGKTYTRQGISYNHFPISELKFPLNVYMFYANLNLTFLDRLTIQYSIHKSLNNRVGKMKDSDWIPFHNIRTIYSESDARLNAVFTGADLVVRLFTFSFFSLKIGTGFSHQYMHYWCSNLEQSSIYDTSSPIYIGRYSYIKLLGKNITYELQYYLYTIQITPVFKVPIRTGILEIVAAIRFSPYVKAKDIDDHILRGKISKGESQGTAFMPFLIFKFIFSNTIFISTKLEYLYLITSGKQTQSYYNPFLDSYAATNYIPGWSAEIENRIKSEQLSVSIGAGYSLEF